MLNPVGEELWTVEGPIVSFYSFPYPTRMAIARLANRQLWLWSPIALSSELAEELEKLGEVRYLVAPNKLHHLFLTETRLMRCLNLVGPGKARPSAVTQSRRPLISAPTTSKSAL